MHHTQDTLCTMHMHDVTYLELGFLMTHTKYFSGIFHIKWYSIAIGMIDFSVYSF